MPYVKSIPIRSTVNRSIAYILNPNKTDELLYSTGLNCVADKTLAYQQFKSVYQQYHDVKKNSNRRSKKPIMAHHFVQSFKEGNITPEKSFEIAQKWAKEMFGDKHQVVIATHIDKGHVHNHFIVNAYNFDGKKYYSNKTTLQRARNISDKISLEYGIQPIQGNQKKGVHYKEWMETKRGSSWKQSIRLAIDKAVIKAKDLEDLLDILKKEGFEVKRGKYISIKPKHLQRFVRIHNLGDAYSEDSLNKRIKNKEYEVEALIHIPTNRKHPVKQPVAKVKKQPYKGIQLKYVSLIKLIADLIVNDKKPARKYNRRRPYSKENDYDINKIASHLRLLNRENIVSENTLYDRHEEIKQAFQDAKLSIDRLSSLDESLQGVIENANIYLQLKDSEIISSSDKLKYRIAESMVKKYNIANRNDLDKLVREREKTRKSKEQLMDKYTELERRYKEFNDLVRTYSKIKSNSYLQEIQRDRSRADREER